MKKKSLAVKKIIHKSIFNHLKISRINNIFKGYSSYLNKFIYDFSENVSTKNFSPYILSECLSNLSIFNRSINKSWLIKDPNYINFIILSSIFSSYINF